METSTLTITGGGEQIVPTINPPITRYDQLIYVDGTNLKSVTSVYLNDENNPLSEGVYSVNDAGTRITIDLTKGGQKGVTGFVMVGYDGGTKKENYNFTPTVTSFDKTEVAVGETITITGTNLDLVDKITFVNGGSSCGVTVQVPGETLTFTVPEGAQTGQITLSCIDGGTTTVTPGQTITITSSGGGNQGGSGDGMVVWTGSVSAVTLNKDTNGGFFDTVEAGDRMIINYNPPNNLWGQLYVNVGTDLPWNSENQIYIHELSNTGLCEFELTADMIEKIKDIGVVYVWMHAETDALLLNISIK